MSPLTTRFSVVFVSNPDAGRKTVTVSELVGETSASVEILAQMVAPGLDVPDVAAFLTNVFRDRLHLRADEAVKS